MIFIKTFENWDSILPLTSIDMLNDYRLCKNCNSVYKVYRPRIANCKYCQSKDYSLINRDTYYEILKSRTDDPLEWDKILQNKQQEEDTFIDLSYVNKNKYIN